MDEVCTCHTKGKNTSFVIARRCNMAGIVKSNTYIYIYILSRLGLYVMTSCQLFFRTALPLSH